MRRKEARCPRKKAWKLKVSICIPYVGHSKSLIALNCTDLKAGGERII